ncbi:MAG: secretin N-terminal domain-containing protein, partial [Phycisphaerae bacterium]
DIVSFLNQLNDTAASGSSVVKIFKLDQATAEDAGELLRGILEGRSGSVGGGSGGSSGGGSQEDALEQLMLVYQAKNPDLTTQTLKGLRTSITVIDDVRTNSLVVTAPPESMGLVESLIVAIDLPPESIAIKVLPLRNSDAEEMVTTLEELFERQGATNTSSTSGSGDSTRTLSFEGGTGSGREEVTFTKDKRTNSVIAAGTKGYLKIAEDTVLQLDSQPIKDRVQIVFEPRNAPAQVLQQMLSDLNDQEQQTLDDLEGEISASRKQERQFVAISSEDMNKIVVDVDPRRQSQIMEIIRELDQPPAQVMIQVLIVNVRLDNSLELGAEFAFQDLQFTKAGPTDSTTFDYVGGTDIGAAGAGLGGFTFTVTGKDFNFLIRTLQNEGSLSVLSRPQIIAMDNQLAKIEVTQDVPYVTGSSAVAGQITTSVGREEVGIILEVTPRINPDGFVRMEIKQEVSDLTDSTIDVGAGVSAPVFLKRNAETFVTVKDNESVVLGGLITSREFVGETKIPILGDIPLLGIFFRAQSQESNREELLVILTPRVVRTPEDYQELSRQERDLTGNIGEDVLLNPLMQGLRVKPEELLPRQGEENIGPYPNEAEPQPGDAPEDDPEIYGPRRSPSADSPKSDPSSYDVPITRATSRGKSVAEARRK